jgi:hypothetical protein
MHGDTFQDFTLTTATPPYVIKYIILVVIRQLGFTFYRLPCSGELTRRGARGGAAERGREGCAVSEGNNCCVRAGRRHILFITPGAGRERPVSSRRGDGGRAIREKELP